MPPRAMLSRKVGPVASCDSCYFHNGTKQGPISLSFSLTSLLSFSLLLSLSLSLFLSLSLSTSLFTTLSISLTPSTSLSFLSLSLSLPLPLSFPFPLTLLHSFYSLCTSFTVILSFLHPHYASLTHSLSLHLFLPSSFSLLFFTFLFLPPSHSLPLSLPLSLSLLLSLSHHSHYLTLISSFSLYLSHCLCPLYLRTSVIELLQPTNLCSSDNA
ncbi:unnamed protein product [Acanthosepion pharaonis]|uniref:Uncharacterized protein n=1 Tax=Acanthosepion pharaonis TaxID=158019 RepID=A0A812D5T6_ACAPH|nr:unnamed protein product [Sepia pharaonis]